MINNIFISEKKAEEFESYKIIDKNAYSLATQVLYLLNIGANKPDLKEFIIEGLKDFEPREPLPEDEMEYKDPHYIMVDDHINVALTNGRNKNEVPHWHGGETGDHHELFFSHYPFHMTLRDTRNPSKPVKRIDLPDGGLAIIAPYHCHMSYFTGATFVVNVSFSGHFSKTTCENCPLRQSGQCQGWQKEPIVSDLVREQRTALKAKSPID